MLHSECTHIIEICRAGVHEAPVLCLCLPAPPESQLAMYTCCLAKQSLCRLPENYAHCPCSQHLLIRAGTAATRRLARAGTAATRRLANCMRSDCPTILQCHAQNMDPPVQRPIDSAASSSAFSFSFVSRVRSFRSKSSCISSKTTSCREAPCPSPGAVCHRQCLRHGRVEDRVCLRKCMPQVDACRALASCDTA